MLNECEDKYNQKRQKHDRNHEQIPRIQKAFKADVKRVIQVIEEAGNPFMEPSADLMALDTKVVMSAEVIEAVKTAQDIGTRQYQQFVEGRLNDNVNFYDSITKNNLPLFKTGSKKTSSKDKMKISNMKSDLHLFSRMYISCQVREGDLEAFFEHENHAWPPSLAENNMMRLGNKSDLMRCLEGLVQYPQETPRVDTKIIDGAALVHSLDPNKSNVVVKTFKDYANLVFVPHVLLHLQSVNRIDVVWDCYKPDSLKSFTRQCRGNGETLRVADNTGLPRNWNSLLRTDSDKTNLYKFLSFAINSGNIPTDKVLLTTYEEHVLSSSPVDLSHLAHMKRLITG